MAVPSAVGRYKRAQPSAAMTNEAGSKTESRSKPLGPSYDYQRLKKLSTQQALENPDWRTRPSDSGSSSTLDDEQKLRALIGAAKQWTGMDAFQTTPSTGDKDGATDSELRNKRRNVFSLSSELEPKIVKTMDEEQPVQYEVLKQICLSSSREHPLSLFEVVPLGTVPGFLSPSIVDIRPLKENMPPKKACHAHDEHLPAALMAAGVTTNKARALPKPPVHKEEAHKKYTAPDGPRLRNRALEQPEMSTTQNSSSDTQSHERLSPGQTARLVTDGGPVAAFEAERDQAFQRFLKKLGQKNRGLQTEKPQQRNIAYEEDSKEDGREGSADTCVLRGRAKGSDGPKEAGSKFFMNHQTRSSETSHKERRASRPAEVSAKFKNLNPKAREFLSFVSQSPNSDNSNPLPYQPLPPLPGHAAKPVADKSGQADAAALPGLGLPNISPPPGLGLPNIPPSLGLGLPSGSTFQQPQPPPYGFMPSAAPNTATDSMAFNSSLAGRLVPLPINTDHSGGQFQASAMSMPQLPPLLPAMFRPQAVMQNMMGNTTPWGFPPAPMMNAAYPWTAGSVNPCFNMPSFQMPPMTGAHHPRQPVPKPRRPDPGDQQAYEAWIEWRKANEPGYALECRLRQQRRAQRSTTDSGGTKASMQKSDASAST